MSKNLVGKQKRAENLLKRKSEQKGGGKPKVGKKKWWEAKSEQKNGGEPKVSRAVVGNQKIVENYWETKNEQTFPLSRLFSSYLFTHGLLYLHGLICCQCPLKLVGQSEKKSEKIDKTQRLFYTLVQILLENINMVISNVLHLTSC